MIKENGKKFIVGRFYTGKTSITNHRQIMTNTKLTDFLDNILDEKETLGVCKKITLKEIKE